MAIYQKAFSVPKTILAILFEITEGTLKAFFPHPYSHAFSKHPTKGAYKVALKRLRDQGLIQKKDGDIFYLTRKGEQEAFLAYINAEAQCYKPQRERWDGKWRIVFFDVPEKYRERRDYLRSLLKALGFKEFQKSIWISPYHIPEFLKRLLQDENILHFTRFITTESIDYEKDLRKKFSL